MNDQNQDEQFQDEQPAEEQLDQNAEPAAETDSESGMHRYAGIISWVVSGALHATILMLMMTIVFLSKEQEQETPPVKITAIPPPPEKKDEKPKLKRELLDPKVTLDIDVKSDKDAPITMVDVKIDDAKTEADTDAKMPKGREEAVADSEMGGTGAFMAIGAGGGGAGMFGSRSGGGRKRAVNSHGGSKGSESSVDAALRWFKKHQSPDGKWDAERYFTNCTETPKCEPGSYAADGVNALPAERIHAAMTGYALLCFLGAGYDHKTPNKYKPTVKKGVDYLLSIQKPTGLFGEHNYENAIATMALAEAYAMTNDPDLRGPAQKGVDMILQRQNQDGKAGGGLGWDYVGPSARNDASVTGWNVMALKSAYAGGLNVRNGMEGSKHWLEEAWKANNDGKGGRPDFKKLAAETMPTRKESVFSYCWPTGAAEYVDAQDGGFGHQNMAPVAMVCAVFLGHKAGDPMLETLANWVVNKQTPRSYPCNTYYMYYNTLGVFQVGGDKWKRWNSGVRDMLVNAQKKGRGCYDGSWDWEDTQFIGNKIGRVLSTAYCTLSLEVYYRYAQVSQLKH